MRFDTAAQELIDALEHVEDTSETEGILIEAAAEVLRVLNIDAQDFIEDICQPAFKAYTMDFLAEVADDERVKVETELYKQVQQLFDDIRTGKADLSAFFYQVLGRNL